MTQSRMLRVSRVRDLPPNQRWRRMNCGRTDRSRMARSRPSRRVSQPPVRVIQGIASTSCASIA